MKQYKHIFFDLDRTLWDFETNSRLTLEEIYSEFDLANLGINSAEEFITKYKAINENMWDLYRQGKITKDLLRAGRFEATFLEYGIKDENLAKSVGHFYVEQSPIKTALFSNAIEVLTYLKKSYHLHIITNGFEEVQFIKLNKSGLEPFFEVVVTSEQAGCKKPESAIFNYAMKRANAVPSESIMIGDDVPVDLHGAMNVGIDSVYFNPMGEKADDQVNFTIQNLIELKEIL